MGPGVHVRVSGAFLGVSHSSMGAPPSIPYSTLICFDLTPALCFAPSTIGAFCNCMFPANDLSIYSWRGFKSSPFDTLTCTVRLASIVLFGVQQTFTPASVVYERHRSGEDLAYQIGSANAGGCLDRKGVGYGILQVSSLSMLVSELALEKLVERSLRGASTCFTVH